MEARTVGWNRAAADVAIREYWKYYIAILTQMRDLEESRFGGVLVCLRTAQTVQVCDRQERVGAMTALLYAGVAEAPGAFEAEGTVPVAAVCEGGAGVAEGAFLQLLRVTIVAANRYLFRSHPPPCCQDVRSLVVCRPAFWRS